MCTRIDKPIFKFRIWFGRLEDTSRCCIIWFSLSKVALFSAGVIGSGGTMRSWDRKYQYPSSKTSIIPVCMLVNESMCPELELLPLPEAESLEAY